MRATPVEAVTESQLVELVASIQPVSWKWGIKGLAYHLLHGNFAKLSNRREKGVIAQDVQAKLGHYFPTIIVPTKSGALRVDYGQLANIALDALDHSGVEFDRRYSDQPQLAATYYIALLREKTGR